MRNLLHGPDVAAALDLLAHARNGSLTAHALALHVVGMSIAATDPSAAAEYQRAAADSARQSALRSCMASRSWRWLPRSRLIPSRACAATRADVALPAGREPGASPRFARGSVISLAGCKAWQAAATVEGTNTGVGALSDDARRASQTRSVEDTMRSGRLQDLRGAGRGDDRRGAGRLSEQGGFGALRRRPLGCPPMDIKGAAAIVSGGAWVSVRPRSGASSPGAPRSRSSTSTLRRVRRSPRSSVARRSSSRPTSRTRSR